MRNDVAEIFDIDERFQDYGTWSGRSTYVLSITPIIHYDVFCLAGLWDQNKKQTLFDGCVWHIFFLYIFTLLFQMFAR